MTEKNICIHDLFMIHDMIIMVVDMGNEFEYYVRDEAGHYAFEFVFGVEKEFTIKQLEALYLNGYFERS